MQQYQYQFSSYQQGGAAILNSALGGATGDNANRVHNIQQAQNHPPSCGCGHDHGDGQQVAAPPPPNDVFHAAGTGDLEGVRNFIEVSKVDVNARESDGTTPLHWAALRNHLGVVQYLLDSGAEIDSVNTTEGQTPLMWAAIGGNTRVAHYLIEQGADIHKVDKRGYNALHHAVQYNQCLISHFMLSKGLYVDCRDTEGHTPLMWAAYQNHEDTCRYLLDQGADLTLKDSSGMTALHWAAIKGNVKPAKLLLKAGAQIDLPDNDGETPIQMSIRKSFPKMTGLLSRARKYEGRVRLSASTEKTVAKAWFCVGFGCSWLFLYFMSQVPLIIGICGIATTLALLRFGFGHLWPGADYSNPTSVGVVSAVYIVSAYVYFTQIVYSTQAYFVTTLLFILLNLIFVVMYFKLLYSNPGYVDSDDGNEWKKFLQSLEKGEPLPQFCLTCMVRRPIRGKHCRACHRCVARFDHHCAWLNNCVGVNNYFPFICLVFTNWLNHIIFSFFCLIFLSSIPDRPTWLPLNVSLPFIYFSEPAILALCIFHMLNVWWQGYLFYSLVRGIKVNLTTNEIINMSRYDYLKDTEGYFVNPFNEGWSNNFRDYIVHPTRDWYHLYHLEKNKPSFL